MTRRGFLQTGAAAAAAQAPGRPNILFIMADQFRLDGVAANGNRLIRTPNLDRLASQSANFQHACVQSPVCVPSRVSFFTGRYPHSHKNRVNYTPCDPREVFLQKLLHQAEYRTGTVGKLHYYPPTAAHARSTGWDKVCLDDGVTRTDAYSDYVTWRRANDPHASVPHNELAPGRNPFRSALNYEFTRTAWTGLQTREMLRELAGGAKPFFLFSSFFSPHGPSVVPPPYDSMYDGVQIPLPRQVTLEEIRKLPLPLQKLILRFEPAYDMNRERLEWLYRSYYGNVSMVDREIGGILDVLDRTGEASNTIVLFSSDHGDQLLEHGLLGKNVFFESSVRVPFLVRWPDRIAPARPTAMMETVDVVPTLLELCGVPIPGNVQGRSLGALLTGRPYQAREMVFSENIVPEVITSNSMEFSFQPGQGVAGIRHPDAKMVRTARWKMTHYPGHGGELYDLVNDPAESRNLYSEPALKSTVRDLQETILDWMITADETDQIAPKWLP